MFFVQIFFVRDAKGPLHGFRASRVPLGIDRTGFVSRKHLEIAKISEIHENGADPPSGPHDSP